MGVVNEIFVPYHAVPKPSRRQAIFHWNLKISFVFRFVVLATKRLCENPGIKDFAKKVISHHPLIVPRHDATSVLKRGCTSGCKLSSFQTVEHTVMELQESDMKLRDDEILVLSWIANQGDALGIA